MILLSFFLVVSIEKDVLIVDVLREYAVREIEFSPAEVPGGIKIVNFNSIILEIPDNIKAVILFARLSGGWIKYFLIC